MSIRQIITGETGCGKTYKAINDEKDLNHRFIYMAPCRQLVYETFRYYGDPVNDSLSTGELKLNMDKGGNFFGVFESVDPESVINYDTIIVDEAHFINDRERGEIISTVLASAMEADINIKLVTATQTFNVVGFENIVLQANFVTPKKVEITYREAISNIKKGMQTIWFCGTIRETESRANWLSFQHIKAIAMNSTMTPTERIKAQIAFEHKDVQVICCTNVLAQGVNFECENLIIDDDFHETNTQLHQKLGRLGRPGTLNGKNEVYYCTYNKPRKIKKSGDIEEFVKSESDRSHIESALERCICNLGTGYPLSYANIKYCIPEFKEFAREFLSHGPSWYYAKKAIDDELEDKECIIGNLKKLKSITKENALICRECNQYGMNSTIKWLSGHDKRKKSIPSPFANIPGVEFIEYIPPMIYEDSDCLRRVVYGLTEGYLNYFKDKNEILNNPKNKISIELLDKINSPKGQKIIQNKINELEDRVSLLKSDEYLDRKINELTSDKRRVRDYNRMIRSAQKTLEMINGEQDKLKDIIIANMRKPPEL